MLMPRHTPPRKRPTTTVTTVPTWVTPMTSTMHTSVVINSYLLECTGDNPRHKRAPHMAPKGNTLVNTAILDTFWSTLMSSTSTRFYSKGLHIPSINPKHTPPKQQWLTINTTLINDLYSHPFISLISFSINNLLKFFTKFSFYYL